MKLSQLRKLIKEEIEKEKLNSSWKKLNNDFKNTYLKIKNAINNNEHLS